MNVEFKTKAVYEILSDELKDHGIVDFFGSKDSKFKKKMVKADHWEMWNSIYRQFENDVELPNDYDPYMDGGYEASLKEYKTYPEVIDKINQNTFELILENCIKNPDWENIIIFIVIAFIDFKTKFHDFSDVIDTMREAKFSEKSIAKVENAFRNHKELYSPKNRASTGGSNNNKLQKNTNSTFNKGQSFSENFEIKKVVKILEALMIALDIQTIEEEAKRLLTHLKKQVFKIFSILC